MVNTEYHGDKIYSTKIIMCFSMWTFRARLTRLLVKGFSFQSICQIQNITCRGTCIFIGIFLLLWYEMYDGVGTDLALENETSTVLLVGAG